MSWTMARIKNPESNIDTYAIKRNNAIVGDMKFHKINAVWHGVIYKRNTVPMFKTSPSDVEILNWFKQSLPID